MAKKKASPSRRPAKVGSTKRLPAIPKLARTPKSPARSPDKLKKLQAAPKSSKAIQATRRALDTTARQLAKTSKTAHTGAKAQQKATRKAIASARKTFDRFRDKITGKLVKTLTAKRSKAHGGTRYVRERVKKGVVGARAKQPSPQPKIRPAPRRREPPRSEYWVKAQTGNRKNRNLINFEVKLTGPRGATDAQAIAAAQNLYEREAAPGWKIDVIQWKHPNRSASWRTDENTAAQYALFNESISVGKG